MTDEQIIDSLNKYFIEIVKKLSAKNWKHFDDYFVITKKYLTKNFDLNFKKNFCNFYVMNGPMGLNNQQQNTFFTLLFANEQNLKEILKTLHSTSGYGNRQKLFLSFATKLIHTTNNQSPIYDQNIAKILRLSKQTNLPCLEDNINNRLKIFTELKNRYNKLLTNNEIKGILSKYRKEFRQQAKNQSFSWQDDILSDVKFLDSLLWSLHDVIRESSI